MSTYKEVIGQYRRKVEMPPIIIEITRLILVGLCLLTIPICGAFLASTVLVN